MKTILLIIGITLFLNSFAQDEYELLVNSGHSKKFQDVDISEDDAIMVILGEDDIISIWDIQKNIQLQRIVNTKTFQADYVELTPNGEFLFLFSAKRRIIEKYDIQLQKVVDSKNIVARSSRMTDYPHLSISPDGKKLIFFDDLKLQMVSTDDLSMTLAISASTALGWNLKFSDNGNLIVHRNITGIDLYDPSTLELKMKWDYPDSLDLSKQVHSYVGPAGQFFYFISRKPDLSHELTIYDLFEGTGYIEDIGNVEQVYENERFQYILLSHDYRQKIFVKNLKTGQFDQILDISHIKYFSPGSILKVSKDYGRIYVKSCCNGPAINVFDVNTGNLIQTMSGELYAAKEISLAGGGTQLYLTTYIDSRFWNLKNGTLNSSVGQFVKEMSAEHVVESKTGLYFAMRTCGVGYSGNTLDIIDSNNVVIRSIEEENKDSDELTFDNNEKYLWALITNYDGKFLHRYGIVSSSKDLVIEIADNSLRGPGRMLITKDGQQVIVDTHNGFTVFDAESGEIIKTTDDVSEGSWGGNGMMLTNDDGLFLWAGEGRIDCYYTKDWRLKYQVEGFNSDEVFASKWGSNDYFAIFLENGDVSLINPQTAKCDTTLESDGGRIIDCVYDPIHDNFFTLGYDGEITLWNKTMNDFALKMIPTRDTGFFIIDKNNMYMASKDALKLVHFKNGLETFTFESLDLTNNQPHKILKTIGVANAEEIKLYENAFDKRLKERGFNEVPKNILDNIPQLTITSLVPVTTNDSKFKFEVSAVSKGAQLNKTHIYINGARLSGKDGFELKQPKNEITASYTVSLSSGLNHIQIGVENGNGQMSSLESLYIVSNYKFEPKQTYLVAIGVSDYKNDNYNLEYSSKDAKDVVNYFKKKYSDSTLHVLELTNSDAKFKALSKIKDFVSQTNAQDELIFFVAGHGVLDEDFNYYFAPYDFDFDKPSKKGWKYSQLEEVFDFSNARKRLLLMDACHSGAVDKESLFITDEVATVEGITFRSGASSVAVQQTSAIATFQTMRSSFADLRNQTGAFVLSSAGGAEYAYESKDWNNGVFTFSFLEGLTNMSKYLDNNSGVDVLELGIYVKNRVSELTSGKQQPNLREVNLIGSFEIK